MATAPPKPMAHASASAVRVFKVTELVEAILFNLNVEDILQVQQVNRQLRDTVEGSKKLQKYFGLLPDTEGSLFTPLLPLPPGQYQLEEEEPPFHRHLWIMFNFLDLRLQPRTKLFSIVWHGEPPAFMGERVRKIVPSQPPPRKMVWYAHYTDYGDDLHVEEELLPSQGEFVTLGDMFDVVMGVYRTLKENPEKAIKDGRFQFCDQILFEAEVPLQG